MTLENPIPATNSAAPVPQKLTGTPIGSDLVGSWGPPNGKPQGNIAAHALDGSLATFWDAPKGGGNWIGLALPTPTNIASIAFAPRPGHENRMLGGIFQGAQNPTFPAPTTLATITAIPVAGKLTTITLPPSTATYRYVRYLAPAGSFGNVAEIQFFSGVAGPIAQPADPPVITPIIAPAGHPLRLNIAYKNSDWKQHALNGAVVTCSGPSGALEALPLAPHVAWFTTLPGNYQVAVVEGGASTPLMVAVPGTARVMGPMPKSGGGVAIPAGNAGVLQLSGCVDTIVSGEGIGKTFVVDDGPASVENMWTNCVNVTVGNFTATSAPGKQTANWGTLRGDKVAIVNVELDQLQSGIRNDSPITNLVLWGIATKSGTSVISQCMYLSAVTGIVVAHCTLLGSEDESPLRMTAPGGSVNGLFYSIVLSQPAGGKAGETDRDGAHQRWDTITCNNCDFSIRTGGAEAGTTPTQTTDVLVTNLNVNEGQVSVNDGASDIHFRGGVWKHQAGECLNIGQTGKVPWPVTKIVVENIDFQPGAGHPPYKVGSNFKPGDVVIRNCTQNGQKIPDFST